MVDAWETTLPCAVTTLSIGISPIAARQAANMQPIAQIVPHAARGTGAATSAAVGDWNSTIAERAGSSCRIARLVAPGERVSKSGMAWPLAVEMAVLLGPELAVDGAVVEKHVVRRAVDGPAVFQDEDLVAIDQGRQAMRNDHHRPAARDAKQIGVQQRLALGIERASRLVEDEDARIGDQRARDRKQLPR